MVQGQCLPKDREVYICVKELEEHRETLQSDIERGLSLSIWACERFSMYVSGQNFELETDRKPLERIHSCASKPCARIEKWGDSYDFVVLYHPGKTNGLDASSRLNFLRQADLGEKYDSASHRQELYAGCPIVKGD